MAEIESLHRKRGAIQAAITNFSKLLDERVNLTPNDRDPDYLQVSLETMQETFKKLDNIQDRIEAIDVNELSRRTELVERYNITVAKARKFLREHNNATSRASTPASTTASIPAPLSVALPRVELPKFDGMPEHWAAFYDLFVSLIDKNENLPAVQKLQYLRLSLTGRAASAIESLETTEQNYNIALATLKQKFECERRTLRRHWAILRDHPRLQKDTPTALNQLIDTVYQHTRALENLKAPVASWDIPLIDLILSKVSQNTAWQWELTLTDSKMPSYKSLLAYLEKRASCSDFTTQNETPNGTKNTAHRQDEGKGRNHKSSQQAPKAQAFTTTTNVSCNFCTGDHRIFTCERFRALSVEERQKAIANKSLCGNCLGKGHTIQNCKSGPCYRCQKTHHTLLHKFGGDKKPTLEPIPSTSQASPNTSSGQA